MNDLRGRMEIPMFSELYPPRESDPDGQYDAAVEAEDRDRWEEEHDA